MDCPDCDGTGSGGGADLRCIACNGSGTLCDRCGEPAEAGASDCDECQDEDAASDD